MSIAEEAFIGTWELDPATLNYQSGRPGRRATYTIERIDGGLQFTLDADDADGKPMLVIYGGSLDGQDLPVPNMGITLALSLVDERTIESVAKQDGKVVDRWTRTLAADGHSMTITQYGVTAAGKEFANSGVYRRS